MLELERERRHESRIELRRPCKIFHPRSGRYFRGETSNVATGGMLLSFPFTAVFEPHDVIHVGIVQHRRHALLRFDELLEAEVIRSVRFNGTTTVAVKFVEHQPVSYLGHQHAA